MWSGTKNTNFGQKRTIFDIFCSKKTSEFDISNQVSIKIYKILYAGFFSISFFKTYRKIWKIVNQCSGFVKTSTFQLKLFVMMKTIVFTYVNDFCVISKTILSKTHVLCSGYLVFHISIFWTILHKILHTMGGTFRKQNWYGRTLKIYKFLNSKFVVYHLAWP
jgi:hypothetical protein